MTRGGPSNKIPGAIIIIIVTINEITYRTDAYNIYIKKLKH